MIYAYIMSMEALAKEDIFAGAFWKTDSVRQDKVNKLVRQKDKERSLGAGLLLQYAVQRYEKEQSKENSNSSCSGGGEEVFFTNLDFAFVYEAVQEPTPFTFQYGPYQKPYLKSIPECYYSLSHSGSYVLCAIGNCEVGADIQEYKDEKAYLLAKRYFTEEETTNMNQGSEEEKRQNFYRLWTAKEAYVKLTGRGLGQGLDSFFVDLEKKTVGTAFLQEYQEVPEYAISVCYLKESVR